MDFQWFVGGLGKFIVHTDMYVTIIGSESYVLAESVIIVT